jgi:phytoene desaturase
MSHADLSQGVYFPLGGMGSMVEGLHKVSEQHGTTFRFGECVNKIAVDEGRASGVHTDKDFIPADIVLSAVDYRYADTELLDGEYSSYSRRYWEKRVMGPSTFIVFLGLTKKLKTLIHHNFFFKDDWKKNFDSIFEHPKWLEDASYYVGVPSKSDDSLCPPDCETAFLLVPVAPGLEDSDELRERYADSILAHLESLIGDDIRTHVAVRKVISQRDFIRDNNIYNGASLGLAHTLRQTAFLRPSHRSRKVPNLYYTGHYTQPGVGVPMQLIGAEMVANRINSERKSAIG